jgi:phosphopantothenoylcysteine decarboxylase/phosphopantothenate--cysteine ligase
MTENARRFVGQAAMASLSEEQVVTDIFLPPPQQHDDHISLTQWAQLIVIAPATANIIGKVAAGIADDALSTIILSARCKTLFAPAMNAAMYNNPIVQENIVKLQRFGCEFIGPDTGALACGERGIGRLADVSDIVRKIETLLQKSC